jgi:polyisoprenoid-binding protein YceI
VWDSQTGGIVFSVQIKSFVFDKQLLQEHFNENYMESDKLPKTSFKGKVLNYDSKTGNYDVEGDLTIHGVVNKVKTKMAISSDGAKLVLSGTFNIKLSDYKLEVPALAKKTLAETAKISIKLALENK